MSYCISAGPPLRLYPKNPPLGRFEVVQGVYQRWLKQSPPMLPKLTQNERRLDSVVPYVALHNLGLLLGRYDKTVEGLT